MNNDKQTSQLKNSFFTVDAEDAKKIQMQLPQGVIERYQSGYDVFNNSTMNETLFKDPKNTSALVKDNGLPYEQFREVVNFQHSGTLEGNGKKSNNWRTDNETTSKLS